MSSYSATFANHGPLPTYTDPDTGKIYSVRYLGQAEKIEYENWLEERARALLFRGKPAMTAAEWQAEWRAFSEACVAGEYAFHGTIAQRARSTPDGAAKLAMILFGCDSEEMFDLLRRRGDEVRAVLDLAIAKSKAQPRDGAGGSAPNVPAPAAG